jgi:hypothetical protein
MTQLYLLDANIFIEAKNRYYSFEIVPSFWTWLDAQQRAGNLASIDMVCQELSKGNDELAQWAKARAQSGWFLPESDVDTQQRIQQIATWVMAQDYLPSAKRDFLGCSDPWLIAKAGTLNAVVVTHESYDPNIKRKVKIPNVCRQFSVATIDTFELLRKLGARF